MPIKLVCGCGNETIYNRSCLQGMDWIQSATIGGGARIICPKCQTVSNKDYEDYLIEGERKVLIEIHVERSRQEAEEKYTPEYVKKLRKEREKIPLPLFKNKSFVGGCPNKKA